MLLHNDYYYWEGELDEKVCNKIIALGSEKFSPATVWVQKHPITTEEKTTGHNLKPQVIEGYRKSDVVWLDEKWVRDLVLPYMWEANKEAGWDFDIDEIDRVQLTRYKVGEFYDWHCDGMSDTIAGIKRLGGVGEGKVRKLSMSILLNDNYEGGEFQYSDYTEEVVSHNIIPSKKIGTIVIFPSFKEHRILSVTKGIKYSLVTWFLGPPFK